MNSIPVGVGAMLFAGVVVWAPQFLTVLLLCVAGGAIFVLRRASVGFGQVLEGLFRAKPLTTLMLFGLLSTIWSISVSSSLEQSAQTLGVVAIAMVLLAACRSLEQRDVEHLFTWLVIAVVLAAGLIIFERVSDFMILRSVASIGRLEEGAFFNQSASILVVSLWLPLVSLRRLGARKFFAIGVFSIAVVGAAVWLTASTTAQVALVGGGLSLVLAYFFPRMIAYIPAFSVALIGLFGPSLLTDPATKELIWSNIEVFEPSFQHRLVIWEFVAHRIQEYPLLGWGLETAGYLPGGAADAGLMLQGTWPDVAKTLAGFSILPLHPHNAALQIRLELGPVGLFLVVWLLVRAGNGIVRHLSGLPRAAASASLLALTLLALSSFGVWQTWFLCLCVSAAALSMLALGGARKPLALESKSESLDGQGNILMISTTDLSVPTASGIHVMSLARAFREAGRSVEIFAEKAGLETTDLNIKTFQTQQLSISEYGRYLKVLFQVFYFARSIPHLRRKRYELIYIRVSSTTPALTLLSKMFLHGPIVTEHNGWIADEGVLLKLPLLVTWLQAGLQLLDAYASAHVRVVSLGLKRILVEKGVPWDKVSVIGNGTDTKVFHPIDKIEACRQFDLDPGRPTVGFIGNLVPWQGIDRLIDALPELQRQVPNVQVLVGGGGILLEEITERLETQGLSDSVRILGWVPYELANTLIGCCDVTVAPFISERNEKIGLSPLKIRDYASAGRPTVTSDLPGLAELAKKGVLVTCDTAVPATLSSVIADLLKDEPQRQEISEKARQFAETNFDWSTVARRILDISQPRRGRAKPVIAHVITGLQVGGAERMLTNYITFDGKDDVEHVVVSLIEQGHFEQEIFKSGTPVFNIGIGRSLFRTAFGFVRLRRILKALEPDILDCWMYHSAVFGFVCAFALPTTYARRIYFHIRCTVLDFTNYSNRLRFSYNACRFMARYVDCTIYNSHAGYMEHVADGFGDARTMVIQNGISTEIFKVNSERRKQLRAEWGVSPGLPVVCTIARFDPMKGYDILLDAADRLAGKCHFVVAGLNTDTALPDRPNLTRLGARRDVPDLLSACDIYCLSSIFGEGFPNALAEAMSVGLTPVAFDVGDSRDIVGDTGFIAESKDSDSLVSAIEQAVALRRAEHDIEDTPPRRRIIEKFSLPPAVRKLDALYK